MRRVAWLLLFAGCDDYLLPISESSNSEIEAILALTGDVTAGEAVFDQHCGVCHDKEGLARKVGPALAAWVQAETPAATIGVVLNGQGTMPAVTLADQEVADLLAWLDDAFGP